MILFRNAKPQYRTISRWIGYCLILLGVQAILGFNREFGYDVFRMPFWGDESDVKRILGGGDFAAYIRAAQLIPTAGLRPFRDGPYTMYPPGLSVLYSVFLKAWPKAPLFAICFFLALSLWAVAMTMLASVMEKIFRVRSITAFFLPLCLLVFPFFSDGLMWKAIGLTEAIATPLFSIACLGCLSIMLFPNRKSWIGASIFGIIFAAAAYIRAQFDFIFMAIFGVSLVILLGEWILAHKESKPFLILKIHALSLLALVTTYQAAIIPYKLYRHAPTIVIIDYAWSNVWMNQPDARKLYGDYVDHGMQSICEISPDKCADFTRRRDDGIFISYAEYRKAALSAARHKPFKLLKFKLPIFWKFWFADMFENLPLQGTYQYAINYALIFCIPLTALYALCHRRIIGLAYSAYAGAYIFATLIFSLLIHIKSRYFLPIKLLSAASIIFVVAYIIINMRPRIISWVQTAAVRAHGKQSAG